MRCAQALLFAFQPSRGTFVDSASLGIRILPICKAAPNHSPALPPCRQLVSGMSLANEGVWIGMPHTALPSRWCSSRDICREWTLLKVTASAVRMGLGIRG
ncbi:hypothetical protein F4859DRAFT_476324 [Xylaria cf. heliscus]|nr:hypothetical protein F4859DRAFT_476324 [Xylaria cf. heliscus]